jgi:hypothetical protein
MRDPLTIIRPRMFPMSQPGYLTSRGWGRLYPIHVHHAFVDGVGAGTTSISVSHFHRVVNGQILPDESDGHTHGLTNIRVAAGI